MITAGMRCGHCNAKAADGDLDFLGTEAAYNLRPGYILEEDAEFHPRSRTWWRGRDHRATADVVRLASNTLPSDIREPTPSERFYEKHHRLVYSVVAVAAVIALWLVVLIGSATYRFVSDTYDLATSDAAFAATFDTRNPTDRANYCHGREYLLNVRGSDVSESVRQQRRDYIRYCGH